jgi:hypothetical protein
MTDGTPSLRWGVAAVAFVAVLVLLADTALGPGLPAPSLGGGDEPDGLPDVEIEFHPNPDSITVGYQGGDALRSDQVYVDVEGGPNETWATWDVDLQSGQPLDGGETMTIEQWSEGQSVRVYYVGNESQGVLASYDP